jgi:TPR repeat protein
MIALGRYLVEGIGPAAGPKTAAIILPRVADAGVSEGQFRLAVLMYSGKTGFRIRSEIACPYRFAAATAHGLTASCFRKRFEQVYGATKDIVQALRYSRKSSDLACPYRMFNLTNVFHHGKNVLQDIPEVIHPDKLAGEAGIDAALFALSELYLFGEGNIPTDS